MNHQVLFDAELIRRYDVTGPRYTSYPTAVEFGPARPETYLEHAERSNVSGRPLSVYIHVPFCEKLCFYCACNKVVTKRHDKAPPYLQALFREMELQGRAFDRERPVEQLHFGGGTPTFLDDDQLAEVMENLGRHFRLLKDDRREYAIEIDPRTTDPARIRALADMGLNRISLGVQDVEERVQRAVNRIQPVELTAAIVEQARASGYKSVSMDLIYGLPLQSADSFARTLQIVVGMKPNRLAVYNYAHLPHLFKPQRRISEADLPSAEEKLVILQQTIEYLTDQGYVYIGMDHFALPDDELVQAQEKGELQRNFQGYSTHGHCDMLGLGVSAIGFVDNYYAQNHKDLSAYQQTLSEGRLAVHKGYACDTDDSIRRAVIQEIMCHHRLCYDWVERRFGLRMHEYFASELQALPALAEDGLIELNEQGFTVTDRGRILLRHVAMVFDRYLQQRRQASFSKVI